MSHGRKFRTIRLALLAVTLAFTTGCIDAVAPSAQDPPDVSGRDNAVLYWNTVALEGVRNSSLGPPMVARALAITHTAIFDAWAAYDATAVGTRLGGALRRPAGERTAANKQEAISYAAYRALVDLFPTQQARFDAALKSYGYSPTNTTLDISIPAGIGNRAAAEVIAFRHHDGSNQLGDLNPGAYSDYTNYQPVNTPDKVNDPSHWQPLRHPTASSVDSVELKCVAPFWNRVIPFALASAAQFRPHGPPVYGTAAYEEEVNHVIDVTANLTERQKVIAEYWADGPRSELPPGHWDLFAEYVSRRDQNSLDEDAKMFFALTNAIFDAGIAAWDAKRTFDSVRPISAIRYMKRGQQIRTWSPNGEPRMVAGENWMPYQPGIFPTPPFQEYISGHSTFSAAGAEILRSFTGSDGFYAQVTLNSGTSRVESGISPAAPITLTWKTFTEAADEAGISRVYGGIHFPAGDLDGRAVGKLVGREAWKKALTYFHGTARTPS